jgi:hypothetical protein
VVNSSKRKVRPSRRGVSKLNEKLLTKKYPTKSISFSNKINPNLIQLWLLSSINKNLTKKPDSAIAESDLNQG